MNPSDPNPKLPTWLFIATDAALLTLAIVIAWQAQKPFSASVTLWIVVLALVGAIAGLVPLVLRVEQQKNAALDERQRELEALARTVASSAEQISIAAGGLHEIADLAQKNLRHAEQLPHKLQEKVAEFQAQVAQAAEADREELERELLALRTTESERLESVSQRIAKSSAEWSKLETATHQHLTAANEAVAKLARGTADAIGKAQVAAEQALALARAEAARDIGHASGTATHAVDAARAAALAELDAKLAAAATEAASAVTTALSAQLGSVVAALDEKIARLEAAASRAAAVATERRISEEPLASNTLPEAAPDAASASSAGSGASAPKRPRKPRRDEAAPDATPSAVAPIHPASTESETTSSEPAVPGVVPEPVPAATDVTPPSPAADPLPELLQAASPEPTLTTEPLAPSFEPTGPAESEEAAPVVSDEPAPVPAEQFVEIAPIAPETAEPFTGHVMPSANGDTAPESALPASPESEKPARKRAAKKFQPALDDEPSLGLELDEPAASGATEGERTLTSDGATRLLVTAYIGIGNRLFIRGDGPGLSWEKGVPLQFVSIGKWRWETNDANSPLQFKLYKNDDVECAGLGLQTLDPSYQQEVTAVF